VGVERGDQVLQEFGRTDLADRGSVEIDHSGVDDFRTGRGGDFAERIGAPFGRFADRVVGGPGEFISRTGSDVAADRLDEFRLDLLAAIFEFPDLAVLGEQLRVTRIEFLQLRLGGPGFGLFHILCGREFDQKGADLAADHVFFAVGVEEILHRLRIVLDFLQVILRGEQRGLDVVADVDPAVEGLDLVVGDHRIVAELGLEFGDQQHVAERTDEKIVAAAVTVHHVLEFLVRLGAVLAVLLERGEGLHKIDDLLVADRQSELAGRRQQAVFLKRLLVTDFAPHAEPEQRKHVVLANQRIKILEAHRFPVNRADFLGAEDAEPVAAELPRSQKPHERHDDHDRERAEQPAAVLVEQVVEFLDNHLRGILSIDFLRYFLSFIP